MHPEHSAIHSPNLGTDLNDTTLSHQLGVALACRVLVVDDDELVRARLKFYLEKSKFEVVVASSGKEALQVLSSTHCQVVLTDWQMPDMDGLTLCRLVRNSASESYVYVVILSIRSSKKDVILGHAAGADDYVIKGAPIEEILARVEIGRRTTHVEYSLRTSNRENRRLAVTDPLTGTHNLSYLMKHLPRELTRSQRYRHPLAILSCDIDGFKQINDRFGHAVGDSVLQAFVARSSKCLRKASDWLARTGGDEFVIVLPETNLQGANLVAHELLHAYTVSPVATRVGPVQIGVSIGATAVEATHTLAGGPGIEELLRAADHRLYDKKHAHSTGNRAGEHNGSHRDPQTPRSVAATPDQVARAGTQSRRSCLLAAQSSVITRGSSSMAIAKKRSILRHSTQAIRHFLEQRISLRSSEDVVDGVEALGIGDHHELTIGVTSLRRSSTAARSRSSISTCNAPRHSWLAAAQTHRAQITHSIHACAAFRPAWSGAYRAAAPHSRRCRCIHRAPRVSESFRYPAYGS
jgi:diguanylate cyclase (GGDEF)-like protein